MQSSATITLIAENGYLHTNFEDITDSALRAYYLSLNEGIPADLQEPTDHVTLADRYDTGEPFTVAWPDYDHADLRQALFSARETGHIPDVASVILPDGSEFNIDSPSDAFRNFTVADPGPYFSQHDEGYDRDDA